MKFIRLRDFRNLVWCCLQMMFVSLNIWAQWQIFDYPFLRDLSISLFVVIVPLLVMTSCLNPSDLAFLEVQNLQS